MENEKKGKSRSEQLFPIASKGR